MAERWISFQEVCELTGKSPRSVFRNVTQGKIIHRASATISANGRAEREYALSSLPSEAQHLHAKRNLGTIGVTKTEIIERGAGRTALAIREPEQLARRRSEVPDRLKGKVKYRLEVIKPLIQLREVMRTGRGNPKSFVEFGGEKFINFVELARAVATKWEISLATIFRWEKRYRTESLTGLAPTVRADQGSSRFFVKHHKAAVYVEQKYLGKKEGNSARVIHEILRRDWTQIGETGPIPSCRTVLNYLRSLPVATTTLAREGEEVFHNKLSPFVLRKAPPAMDTFIADHRVHDVHVRNVLFSHLKFNQRYRPWITAVYDWGSRKLMGLTYGPTPSSQSINSALRMAVSRAGFPKNFYWDNGEDFKAVERTLFGEDRILISDDLSSALNAKRVEVRIVSALPFHPRSKPIESYFSRWSKRFDPMWKPAYGGNRPEKCLPSCREAQKMHEQFLLGKRETSPLPTDAEFIRLALQWADEYNATPLDALDGRTPDQVFAEQCPQAACAPADKRLLDQLFWQRETRSIGPGGCVNIDRLRYEPTPESFAALTNFSEGKRKVRILRDPYNIGEAIVLDLETGEFVGELRVQELIQQNVGDRLTQDHIRAAMRKERAFKRSHADYLLAIQSIADACGFRTEREYLAERAGMLRTGTDDIPVAVSTAAPGAGASAPHTLRTPRRLPASPFVSDAVDELISAGEENS